MRILYSHRTNAADGQYVHIRELTHALSRQGHDIHMVSPAERGDRARRQLAVSGAVSTLRKLLPAPAYELAELGYSLAAYRQLLAAAATFRPDIIYERYNLFYPSGLRAARKLRLPLILEVNAPLADERAAHGNLRLKPLARWSERAVWRGADHVLPVTRVLAERIIAEGVDPERITIIQNGVGDPFLAPVDPRPVRERYGLAGKIVLGFTGFIRDWHGVDKAIHFLHRGRDERLHLLVVGDGPARPNLERLARSLGVAAQTTFTGLVQRESMPEHAAAFDIALQPAVVAYASPLKLFEYMALGKAIVAPASPNIMEVLSDGEDALLFTAGDDDAFFAALKRLAADSELRSRLGGAARASLERQDLTWAGNARRVASIGDRLIEAYSSSSS